MLSFLNKITILIPFVVFFFNFVCYAADTKSETTRVVEVEIQIQETDEI